MKKILHFTIFLAFLISCSGDDGTPTPPEPVPPTANFSASETNIETGSIIIFTDSSQFANSYEWTFDGGNPTTSTAKNPEVTYATAGSYSVSLKVVNADGSDTETKTNYIVVVDPASPPIAEFLANSKDIETGESIEFTDNSSNSPTEWAWEFEGGNPLTSTEQNPTVTYPTKGTYSVTLTVTNDNGSDQEIKTDYITVTDPVFIPVAEFSTSATTITSGNDITFTDESTNEPTSWVWEFEGGNPSTSTEQNPTVTYPTKGIYSVTLTVTNDNGSDQEIKTDYITVTDPVFVPVAEFNASATTITSGNDISFSDESTNEPTSWVWEFEGGSPSSSTVQNPTVTYNNFGTYEVSLTATNSAGSDTETKTGYITVNQQTVSYTVTFKTNWTATNHPTDFPSTSDHFSSSVGMVHKPGASFFKESELASLGIKDVAERGQNGEIQSEIQAIVNAGDALSYFSGVGLPHGTTERTFTIDVTEEYSMITLVSMIAPSPDWFVAVENLDLFDNGQFIDNIVVGGISYDSGTDSGSTFTSSNQVTNPAVPIFKITEAPLGNGSTVDPPVAFFTFVKN